MPYPMSKKTSKKPSEGRKTSPKDSSSSPLAGEFVSCLARVVLEAQRELQELLAAPVDPRRLVNYLRGNQAPPAPPPDSGRTRTASDVNGLLWAMSAAWLEEFVDQLDDEGYLEMTPAPKRGLVLGKAGEHVLAGDERPGTSLLPRRAALGTHPELESRLRSLRKRLADGEGRPSFSIFSNSTLAHLAAYRPRNLGELASVPGLGEQRIRKYGRKILAALTKK